MITLRKLFGYEYIEREKNIFVNNRYLTSYVFINKRYTSAWLTMQDRNMG